MPADPVALGTYLKARRASRTPESAGLPGGGRRRAPGLRREELAALAGVSVDYLTRLEQGRHREPSAGVLGALATALGLNAHGRRHLFALGGRPDPGWAMASARHVSQPVRRLVERSMPSPAFVMNRRRDVLVANDAARALLGDPCDPDDPPNLLELTFTERRFRSLWADWPLVAQDTVAQLRGQLTHVPPDDDVHGLVARLAGASPEFAELWDLQDVARACNPVRAVDHPVAGALVFDVELLDAADGDLQIVVLEPSDAASRAAWVRALGEGEPRLRAL